MRDLLGRHCMPEAPLDAETIREKLNAFTNIIDRYMNDYADRLELEHRGSQLRLDICSSTLAFHTPACSRSPRYALNGSSLPAGFALGGYSGLAARGVQGCALRRHHQAHHWRGLWGPAKTQAAKELLSRIQKPH